MYPYMNSKEVAAHLNRGEQEDRLDRLHNGEIYEGQEFYGLAARLMLDGSYVLWAYQKESADSENLVVTTPGRETLSDRGLERLHQVLTPLAATYAEMDSADTRRKIEDAADEEIAEVKKELETVSDVSYYLAAGEDQDSLPASIPSGLSEPEVASWVYANSCTEDGYANREALADFMIGYYPEIEKIRRETQDD